MKNVETSPGSWFEFLSGSVWNPGSDDTHIMSWLMKKKPRRPAPFVLRRSCSRSFQAGPRRKPTLLPVPASALKKRASEAGDSTTSSAVLLNFAGFENMTGRF